MDQNLFIPFDLLVENEILFTIFMQNPISFFRKLIFIQISIAKSFDVEKNGLKMEKKWKISLIIAWVTNFFCSSIFLVAKKTKIV